MDKEGIILELGEEKNSEAFLEEREDLEDEIETIEDYIDELYDELEEEDLSEEEKDEILVEIANQRTMIRDIECMIAELQ